MKSARRYDRITGNLSKSVLIPKKKCHERPKSLHSTLFPPSTKKLQVFNPETPSNGETIHNFPSSHPIYPRSGSSDNFASPPTNTGSPNTLRDISVGNRPQEGHASSGNVHNIAACTVGEDSNAVSEEAKSSNDREGDRLEKSSETAEETAELAGSKILSVE